MTYQPKPGVCDCSETPLLEEEAIILYPSLGTPLLLAAGQTKASIFIAAPSSMRGKVAGQPLMGKAVNMYKLVDQHLRVVDLDSKQEQQESEQSTKTGTLFGDGKDCATARQYITGWRVGSFGPGALISDRHGRPFATIAPAAAQLYTRMQDVYEIELDLSAPPFAKLQTEGSLVSLAWMIRLGKEDRKLPGFGTHAEAQDVAIARFLEKQVAKDPFHFKTLQEFQLRDPGGVFARSLPGHKTGLDARLKSWHPVKRLAAKPLKLGHLSDVHVSVRHNALACSPAKVLEDESTAAWNRRVGEKVCNSFEALKKLFEQMAEGEDKADAVLFTGDLIDYNRNLNPKEVSPSRSDTIGEQWKAFNLLANIFDQEKGPRLYPRGLDDMLVYSLVREMYRKHKLPIIMTSGNHEAYQVPYGISARVEAGDRDNWAFELGVLEATTADHRTARKALEESAARSWPDGRVPGVARSAQRAVAQSDAVERHRQKIEAASAWTRGKANEGMSRDHNMTVYEACLAYGPTYGHALTGFNFSGEQFDWFYALFTPLADVVYAYGADSADARAAGAKQVVAALGWGVNENFKNLGDASIGKDIGVDRQGAGILPRATESFSDDQLKLVEQARRYKAASKSSLTVATHFTMVSFDEPEPYSAVVKTPERTRFVPNDSATSVTSLRAAFNHVNVGTCEKNQQSYLDRHVKAPGGRNQGAAVDWHLSGHSHRSGVYQVAWQQPAVHGGSARRIQVTSARDPGIHGPQTVKADSATALIVSSCGGPIGYQNLDGELSAWTGRPPAGTLLDPATGRIKQVKTARSHIDDGQGFNEKPRLCVALDYLHVMSGIKGKGGLGKDGAIEVPLRFKPGYFAKDGELELVLSEQVRKLQCIEGVVFWVFESGKDSAGDSIKAWRRMAPTLNGSKLTFIEADKAKLVSLMQTSAVRASDKPVMAWSPKSKLESYGNADFVMLARRLPQALCEVQLKKPKPTEAGEDWARDMQCTDPWVFPLDVALIDGNVDLGAWSLDKSDAAKAVWLVGRPAGERGEVPDWEFLARSFEKNGYIPPKDAIKIKP